MTDTTERRFAHRWQDESGQLVCLVTIDYRTVNGRFEAQILTVRMSRGRPITTTVLRELPVGTWMAEDRRRRRNRTTWDAQRTGLTRKDRQDLQRQRVAAERAQAGRPRITYEQLVEVAAVYRDAHKHTNAPTQAVAAYFNRSRSTAAKWVQRAREEGLLGPTEERRSGEQRSVRKVKK